MEQQEEQALVRRLSTVYPQFQIQSMQGVIRLDYVTPVDSTRNRSRCVYIQLTTWEDVVAQANAFASAWGFLPLNVMPR